LWDGSTKREAQFYLAFTGSEFTWVTGTRLSVIAGQWRLGRLPGDWMKRLIAKHSLDGIPFLTPAEAIAAWAERKTFTTSGVQNKKDRKRVSNEPTPELPSVKRRKPENETPSPAVAQGVAEHPRNETRAISYPYSLVTWPHVSHWTVMQPSFPRPPTPPSDASDKPVDPPATPPSTFVLRPATFASPLSPANESQPSDDPPPTPPAPVPQLQPPPTESRPPPAMYPHVSFTPTLAPPRYGERTRKQVIRFKTVPATTGDNQSAPVIGSASTSTSSTADLTNSTGSGSVSAPPITEGRRVPEGAIDAPPSIRGKYAKAGATQRGWSLYVGARFLLCYFALHSGSDLCTNAYIYRRQSSSCPFLATSANGQVPFVPV
jgi:hypothetical protein